MILRQLNVVLQTALCYAVECAVIGNAKNMVFHIPFYNVRLISQLRNQCSKIRFRPVQKSKEQKSMIQ